jgi:hypothetical protein
MFKFQSSGVWIWGFRGDLMQIWPGAVCRRVTNPTAILLCTTHCQIYVQPPPPVIPKHIHAKNENCDSYRNVVKYSFLYLVPPWKPTNTFFLQFSDTFPFIPYSFPHTIMYIQGKKIFPHLPSLRWRNQFRIYRYPKCSNLAVAVKVRCACVLRFLLCSVPTTLAIFVLPQSILPSISISK